MIDAAAVLGRAFDWRLLSPMTGDIPELVSGALARGVDRQILSADGTSFRFRHALTREAVLEALLPPRHQALAAAALSALEEAGLRPGAAWHDLAADLAVRAGDRRRAAVLLAGSGRAALERGALATAVDTLQRAAGLSDGDDTQPGIEQLLVEALALAGRVDEAHRAGSLLVRRLAERPGSGGARAEVHLALARAAVTASRWPMARSNVDSARELLGSSRSAVITARMAVLEAEVALAADDNPSAVRLAHRALPTGAAGPEVRCHALEIIGRAERLHDLDAARAAFGQALETAQAAQLPLWRLRALHELGTIDLFDHAGTGRLLAARRTEDELGAVSTAAILDLQLSAAFVCRWEIDRCAAHLRSAVVLAEQLGLALVRALALCHLAHCSAFKGDSAESGRLAALALSAMPGDAELEAFCLCARGIIPLLNGDRHGAIEALGPGMAILARLPQAAPAAIRAVWPLLLASAGDGQAAAAINQARRLGVGAFRLNRGLLGYAEAIVAGRAGTRRGHAGSLPKLTRASSTARCGGTWPGHWPPSLLTPTAGASRATGWPNPGTLSPAMTCTSWPSGAMNCWPGRPRCPGPASASLTERQTSSRWWPRAWPTSRSPPGCGSPPGRSKSTSRRCSARPASVRVLNWRSWRHSHRPRVVRRNT